MAFGQFIEPDSGEYTEDHVIGKAFEALRVRFGNRLPDDFVAKNWERARLALRIEGRGAVLNALLPFAEAQASDVAVKKRQQVEDAKRLAGEYPQMAKMIERGQT